MKMYDWGIFWEDGNRASLPVPFGPVHPNNTIFELDGEWVEKILQYMPNFVTVMNELPFGFIVVNPPRDAEPEEIEEWKARGYDE